MKKLLITAISLTTTISLVLLSGCIDISSFSGPTPTPRPTFTPTVIYVPTPSPTPLVLAQQSSGDVRIIELPRFDVFTFDRDETGQVENVTMVVCNDGISDVKNVVLVLTIDDSQSAENLVTEEFRIGDLARGDRKQVYLKTPRHDYANAILIQVKVKWGEYGEYYNPKTFINKAFSVYVM